MKLVRYDDWRTGVLVSDDTFVDVAGSMPALAHHNPAAAEVLGPYFTGYQSRDWAPMIESWNLVREPLAELVDLTAEQGLSSVRSLAEVTLLPPLPSPSARIFALGANFADHAANALTRILGRTVTEDEIRAERDNGLPPYGFTVIPQTVAASGSRLLPPPGATMVDYEAEVAVVLRHGGRHLASDDLDVWGFTAFNDFSIRDHFFGRGERIDRGALTWALSKNFQTASFCGPVMVVDEPYDIHDLRLRSQVNGQTRQDSSTAHMVYSFGDAIEHLSKYFELLTGDMVVSGTPAGTVLEDGADGHYLCTDDEVAVIVDGVGVLRTSVGAAENPPRSTATRA